jgi:hypothetical protein
MTSSLDEFDFNSLMDWSRPILFKSNSRCTPMSNVFAMTRKLLDKSQKLLERIESAEQTSRDNVQSIPTYATIRKEYVRCGKLGCEQEPHGPYYYAYWKEDVNADAGRSACRKKLKKKHIGTRLPNGIIRT